MSTEVTVKKIGNSMGVLFSKQYVEKEGLKPNQKLLLEVVKKADLADVFGSLKTKMTGQQFKDFVRKGWE
ncbi:MAG: hypothetical protein HY917_00570 [Candidatus Diapherotrites archaeon]|nr:hypothetical protein [Candidatus Diapherotrites archaeon]